MAQALTYEEVKAVIEDEGDRLLSDTYVNNKVLLR
jgi:hypothetical protein